MSKRVTFILNSSASFSNMYEAASRICELVSSDDVEAKILLANSNHDLHDLARTAVSECSDMVVAGGGDGTVNAVASVVVGSKAVLGVLPLGTLNHFAKDLGIPLALEAAARAIVDGEVVSADVGEVNGQVFLNNSSIGLYPRIVEERTQEQQKGRPKWVAFLHAAVSVLKQYPLSTVHIVIGGKELRRRTPLLFVGNNRYELKGFEIGRRRGLNGGELYVVIASQLGPLQLFILGLKALPGGAPSRGIDVFSVSELWVETHRRRVRVAIDGEVRWMQTPLHYRIRPGALKVIVPKSEARAA